MMRRRFGRAAVSGPVALTGQSSGTVAAQNVCAHAATTGSISDKETDHTDGMLWNVLATTSAWQRSAVNVAVKMRCGPLSADR